MKLWRCPNCKLPRQYDHEGDDKLVMKICTRCGNNMEVVDDGE